MNKYKLKGRTSRFKRFNPLSLWKDLFFLNKLTFRKQFTKTWKTHKNM